MIMKDYFLSDLKDYIRATPEGIFLNVAVNKSSLINGQDERIEILWMKFQKSIEEYGCDAWYAYQDALFETFGIEYQVSEDEPIKYG